MTRDDAALVIVTRGLRAFLLLGALMALASIGVRAGSTVSGLVLENDVVASERVSFGAMSSHRSATRLPALNNSHGIGERYSCGSDELMQRLVVQFVQATELDQGDTVSAMVNKDIVSTCLALASWRSPSAVAWFISPIWVDAIKGMANRSWSHVSAKGSEVLSPLIAHRDPAPSIVRVADVRRVVAALFGMCPRSVFNSRPTASATATRCAVRDRMSAGNLTEQAAATARTAVSERLPMDDALVTAVASAEPFWMPSCVQNTFNRNQAPEAYSGQVVEFHWRIMPYRVTPS